MRVMTDLEIADGTFGVVEDGGFGCLGHTGDVGRGRAITNATKRGGVWSTPMVVRKKPNKGQPPTLGGGKAPSRDSIGKSP